MSNLPKFSVILAIVFLFGCGKKSDSSGETVRTEPPKTDLHSAVVTGDLDVIRGHVKAGSDLNVLEPSRASTPLITAAALGKPEAARILLNAGADLNYQNADGSTALHTAIVFDHMEIVKILTEAGADLNIRNNQGATPLHTAAFLCRPEAVRMLLDKGADPLVKNNSGKTARETVEQPFEEVRAVYDAIGAGLKPFGLRLDYEYLKTIRPKIAEMLKQPQT